MSGLVSDFLEGSAGRIEREKQRGKKEAAD